MYQRLTVMEEKLHGLDEANMTLEHVVLLSETASALEDMKSKMQTLDDYEDNLDKLDYARELMDVRVFCSSHPIGNAHEYRGRSGDGIRSGR